MQFSHPLAYAALGASTAISLSIASLYALGGFTARATMARDVTGSVILIAGQVVTLAAFWMMSRAQRSEVAALHNDIAEIRSELAHIDEHTELLASRTARLAQAVEVRKAVQPANRSDPESTGEVMTFPSGPRRIR